MQHYSKRIEIFIVLLMCSIASLWMPTHSMAFSNKNTVNIREDEPVQIESEEMYYDKARDLVSALHDVTLVQGNQIITADSILFYRQTDEIYAEGNVSFLREDGSIFFADKAKINRGKNSGVILNFKARMGEQGHLASALAEMENENVINLSTFVYSPCNICNDNFIKDTALWQVRARQATLNKEEERVYYHDATLEAFGVPVAYTPYLVMPSPGAKRKSGLLIPRYSWKQDFGSMVRIPIYLNIAPNMDATVGSKITQHKGLVNDLEFRHLTKRGGYDLYNVSTYTDKVNKLGQESQTKKGYRGFFKIDGKMDFSDNDYLPGNFVVKSKFMHDGAKTFAKRYNVDQADILTTDVIYQSKSSNAFTYMRGVSFQDARADGNAKTTAKALPNVSHEQRYKLFGVLDSKLGLNYVNLHRAQGLSYNRIVGQYDVSHKRILPLGFVLKNMLVTRGDVYESRFKAISATTKYTSNLKTGSSTTGRFVPQYVSELSYPLVNHFDRSSIILEPMVQAVLSPNSNNLKNIDNEDSQAPEISYSNLFSYNKFKGNDLIENGKRLNYGLKGNIRSPLFHNLNMLVGQSVRMRKDKNFTPKSGLDGLQSDYVAKISFQPDKHWYLNNEARLENKEARLNRNEVLVNYTDTGISFSLLHFYIGRDILDPIQRDKYRQEVVTSGSYKFYKDWWIHGGFHRKIGNKRRANSTHMISSNIALSNKNECLETRLTATRVYTQLKDLKPSTTYAVDINVPIF